MFLSMQSQPSSCQKGDLAPLRSQSLHCPAAARAEQRPVGGRGCARGCHTEEAATKNAASNVIY